ncbi:MAG: hypothetical protein MZV63_22660 [Marinilabiliales bacterium]|nr:hypothetical protein [Marinilabiliales bacterium]
MPRELADDTPARLAAGEGAPAMWPRRHTSSSPRWPTVSGYYNIKSEMEDLAMKLMEPAEYQ